MLTVSASNIAAGSMYPCMNPCTSAFWSKMQADVDRFVRNCHTRQRSRTLRYAPFGILRPLPNPDRPWQGIAMDFVTGLPTPQGYDAIWVVVDRLTKACYFAPLSFFCRRNRPGGPLRATHLPPPRPAQFHRVRSRPPVRCSVLAAAMQPPRDRLPPVHSLPPRARGPNRADERRHEQCLRAHVNYLQDDWPTWLPLAEFAANNQASETTGLSPFFRLYGRDPV